VQRLEQEWDHHIRDGASDIHCTIVLLQYQAKLNPTMTLRHLAEPQAFVPSMQIRVLSRQADPRGTCRACARDVIIHHSCPDAAATVSFIDRDGQFVTLWSANHVVKAILRFQLDRFIACDKLRDTSEGHDECPPCSDNVRNAQKQTWEEKKDEVMY
jgi:hypothetical protein